MTSAHLGMHTHIKKMTSESTAHNPRKVEEKKMFNSQPELEQGMEPHLSSCAECNCVLV